MPDSAATYLALVSSAYESCGSYRDAGEVVISFSGQVQHTRRQPFSTRFIRSRGFLFEFRSRVGPCSGWHQYAVWLENSQPKSWWSVRPGLKDLESLGHGIARATGVSGGSASRVPPLLMPDVLGRHHESRFREAQFIDVPDARNQGCVVIECPYGPVAVEQIWIESSTRLIRKVVQPRHPLGPLPPDAHAKALEAAGRRMGTEAASRMLTRTEATMVECVTTYNAAFDAPIDLKELRFSPPAGSN